jgi:hypothetical protein
LSTFLSDRITQLGNHASFSVSGRFSANVLPKAVIGEHYAQNTTRLGIFKIFMFPGLPKPRHPAHSCIAGLYMPRILAIIPIIEHTGTLFLLPDTIRQLNLNRGGNVRMPSLTFKDLAENDRKRETRVISQLGDPDKTRTSQSREDTVLSGVCTYHPVIAPSWLFSRGG